MGPCWLSCCNRQKFPVCLTPHVKLHVTVQASPLQSVAPPASPPSSMLAAQLLLQVVSEPHSNILARWTGLHPYISSAVSVALQHASEWRPAFSLVEWLSLLGKGACHCLASVPVLPPSPCLA